MKIQHLWSKLDIYDQLLLEFFTLDNLNLHNYKEKTKTSLY